MVDTLQPRNCKLCKARYQPKTEWQKYCTAHCRFTASNRRKVVMVKAYKKLMRQSRAAKEAL